MMVPIVIYSPLIFQDMGRSPEDGINMPDVHWNHPEKRSLRCAWLWCLAEIRIAAGAVDAVSGLTQAKGTRLSKSGRSTGNQHDPLCF